MRKQIYCTNFIIHIPTISTAQTSITPLVGLLSFSSFTSTVTDSSVTSATFTQHGFDLGISLEILDNLQR